MQIKKKIYNFFYARYTRIMAKIKWIIDFFSIFSKCEKWVKEKLAHRKKCREDAYDIGLTNHCLNDILTMEAVNASVLDRSYLRSLGKLLYLKYRDREIILPCDKRHFSSFSLKSFGLYIKIQDDRVVRIKMMDHIWHEELALFTETEQDILSFYSHAIPVNLSRQNKILYMKYILYIEGNGWINRAVKTLTMKTVFKVDEEVYSINPFGEYEFRHQRRTAEPVMNVHKIPKPFFRVLVYQYSGKKEKLENTIKKITDWWESIKNLNFYETYKHRKEEFIGIYWWILALISFGLFIWFASLPYFENMSSSIEVRWGLPIRSVYSLEPELDFVECDEYVNAARELALPYSNWILELDISIQKNEYFSTHWLDYFDKSSYLKKENYLTTLDNTMYFYRVENEFIIRQERISKTLNTFLSLND